MEQIEQPNTNTTVQSGISYAPSDDGSLLHVSLTLNMIAIAAISQTDQSIVETIHQFAQKEKPSEKLVALSKLYAALEDANTEVEKVA